MVAGEASGDMLAALLLQAVQERWSGVSAFGIGGPRMAEQGFDTGDDYDERYRRAQESVEKELSDNAGKFQRNYQRNKYYEKVREDIANADKVIEEQQKEQEAEAKRAQEKYDFNLERDRSLFATRASNLSADLRKKAEKAQEDAILKEGGPELLATWKKDKKAKEEGAKWLAKEQESRRIQRQKQEQIDAKIREKANKVQAIKDAKEAEAQAIIDAQNEIKAQNEKLTQDILDISDRLAKDQVLRLKMLVVSNSTAVDLAQQLTIQGDRLEQEIRNSRTEFQFNIAQRGGANGSDFKIQNDVDYYKEELEKCKMCIVNFKKKAIDQYNLDMANLEQKKEELKSKVFEIKEPQEANKGSKGKDWAERSVDEINKEIANVKARLAVSGIKPDEKASKEKFLAKLQSALASKKSGGYRRRITLRQPPKPRHRVY